MKTKSFIPVILLIFSSFTPPEEEYDIAPVLMTREVLESSIRFAAPAEIENPGKIYIFGSWLFINEKYKGVHIVDNTNPASPVKKGFITIPGCIDIVVKGNILYADNAVDLVAIDFTDFNNSRVTERIVNAFPELRPPGYEYIPWKFTKEERPENTIIVGWENI